MITPIQSATQPGNTAQTTAPSVSSGLASDFETFLLMLTAQARNQDPLEPLDSTEYASQLAQFSMVEQQVQTNDLLTGLALPMGNVDMGELASWVGMEVRSPAAFRFDGQPVTLLAQASAVADSAVMIIRDKDGAVIDRIPVPTDQAEFEWAGTDGTGTPLPTGSYSATLESYDGEELVSQQLAAVYNRVVEAQVGEGAVLLTLESGQVVPVGDVTAVRAGA